MIISISGTQGSGKSTVAQKIADKCDVNIELGNWDFPKFKLPKGKTAEEVLCCKSCKKCN